MLVVLISWCWIGTSAFLWGFAFCHWMDKAGRCSKTLDSILVCGLCFLTVYAQWFSLFQKVGVLANILLLIINVILVAIFRKEIWAWMGSQMKNSMKWYRLMPLLLIIGIVMAISATGIGHYDTYLYHAQSIRWIEEYGVVKGLGNLHNRLAYNSSLFSLQALFSLKFLTGRSLHTVNGFVTVIFVSYALLTIKFFSKKKFYTSDLFRLILLYTMLGPDSCSVISSPGSDTLALGMTVYLITVCLNYLEKREEAITPYAVLGLLGVFTVSVKLSAAMIVLLVLIPAIELIRKKRWKEIFFYLILGSFIISPFLIRNVIISGYLVYPYPELDLFQVDWKMPGYTLLFDRNEIKTWGWGLNDVFRFDASFREWFPVWKNMLGKTFELLLYINVLLIVPAFLVGIYEGIKKRNWNFMIVSGTILSLVLLWLVGSPLPRYGKVFLLLLPAYMIGKFLESVIEQRRRQSETISRGARLIGILLLSVCIILCLKTPVNYVYKNPVTELNPPDYMYHNAEPYYLGEQIIYVPSWGDQIGYHAFPSTPYAGRLELIELRGKSLKDGFQMKEEYRNAFISTYGQVYSENAFVSQ